MHFNVSQLRKIYYTRLTSYSIIRKAVAAVGWYKFRILGKYKCQDCGVKINFKRPVFRSRILGQKEFMIQASMRQQCLCHHCLLERILSHTIFGDYEVHDCDWCGRSANEAPTARNLFVGVRSSPATVYNHQPIALFGGSWWNGHSICQDCLTEGFVDIKVEGIGHVVYLYNVEYWPNEDGVYVPRSEMK